jgi:hypothetical protein
MCKKAPLPRQRRVVSGKGAGGTLQCKWNLKNTMLMSIKKLQKYNFSLAENGYKNT